MEIERKFKVLNLPEGLDQYPKKEIEQGYLCIKPTVRIRKSDNKYTLNYKWKDPNVKEKLAIQNIEYEMPLTEGNYKILFNKVENNMIIKTRYKIKLENNLNAEVDIFHNKLEGLVFAEVEFPDIETSEKFKKPSWMGEDISFDKRYDNTLLSKIDEFNSKDFM